MPQALKAETFAFEAMRILEETGQIIWWFVIAVTAHESSERRLRRRKTHLYGSTDIW